LRFSFTGAGATALYAVLSMLLHWVWHIPAMAASFLAYCAAAVFSYLGHYHFTFRSRRRHDAAIPVFGIVTALGYTIALASPWLFVQQLHWPMFTAVIFTSLVVPALNFLLLNRLVFCR